MNSLSYLATLTALVLFFGVATSSHAQRTWTDRKGRQIEADFISLDAGKVRIKRKSDGQVFDVPLETLSDKDQDFAKKARAENLKAELGIAVQPAQRKKLALKKLQQKRVSTTLGYKVPSEYAKTLRSENTVASRLNALDALITKEATGDRFARYLDDQSKLSTREMSVAEYEAKLAELEFEDILLAKAVASPSTYLTLLQQRSANRAAKIDLEIAEFKAMNNDQFAARLDALHQSVEKDLASRIEHWLEMKDCFESEKSKAAEFKGTDQEFLSNEIKKLRSKASETAQNLNQLTAATTERSKLQAYFVKRNAAISK